MTSSLSYFYYLKEFVAERHSISTTRGVLRNAIPKISVSKKKKSWLSSLFSKVYNILLNSNFYRLLIESRLVYSCSDKRTKHNCSEEL